MINGKATGEPHGSAGAGKGMGGKAIGGGAFVHPAHWGDVAFRRRCPRFGWLSRDCSSSGMATALCKAGTFLPL